MDNKCQGIHPDGEHCESTDTETYELHGKDVIYSGLWVEVYLCADCSGSMGVS